MEVVQTNIESHELDVEDQVKKEGYHIRHMAQRPPGISYGYRIEHERMTIEFYSDSEHKADAYHGGYLFVPFFQDGNLLIFDAQSTLTDSVYAKEDRGHYSNVMGKALAMRAGVKHLCLFHIEPCADDEKLAFIETSNQRYDYLHDVSYPLKTSHACHGPEIEV